MAPRSLRRIVLGHKADVSSLVSKRFIGISFFIFLRFYLFLYLRDRVGERERNFEPDSTTPRLSVEPDPGLDLMTARS